MVEETSKSKVIFILPYLYPGGAERALITLMHNLDRAKFEPELIALKRGGKLEGNLDPSIKYHSFKNTTLLKSFFNLLICLKHMNPDIIVTTMVHSNFLVMLLKPFFPKVRFIIREAVVPSSILNKHKKKSPILKILYRILYPKAHKVLSPSQDIIYEFSTLIGLDTDKNHTVLYNQVDTDAISDDLKNIGYPTTPNKGTVKFVCAGRLHYQKGYDRLINALMDFKGNWTLVILGEGEELNTLKDLVKNNSLENNIHFIGHVHNPCKIIAASDCLLLPSRWEGMPNVVLESLACGTQVIAMPEANGVKEIKKQCAPGVVQRAKDMNDFIHLMHQVKPYNKIEPQESLLPIAFRKSSIMARFEEILKSP